MSGFRVYVGWGSTCPVPQHLQGATEKTAVCLRETENVRKREWRANRHASQERHFWSEYTDSAVLCLTFFLLHSYYISCPVTIPVSSYDLSPTVCLSNTHSAVFFNSILLYCKIIAFSQLYLPAFPVLTFLHYTVMVQYLFLAGFAPCFKSFPFIFPSSYT